MTVFSCSLSFKRSFVWKNVLVSKWLSWLKKFWKLLHPISQNIGDSDVDVRFLFSANKAELLNWKVEPNGRFASFKEASTGGFSTISEGDKCAYIWFNILSKKGHDWTKYISLRNCKTCIRSLHNKTNSIYEKNSFIPLRRKQMTDLRNDTLVPFYTSGISKSWRVNDIKGIVQSTPFLRCNFIDCDPFSLRYCLNRKIYALITKAIYLNSV